METRRLATLKPLMGGRVTRAIFGLGCFVLIAVIGTSTLTAWGTLLIVLLGLSFLIGGLTGNPGCELTALPNLILPREKRVHFT